MIALPYLSAIRFSGVDAGDFLHNQLSTDVLALSDGESAFACYCEPKGRVLALMLVSRDRDDYYAVMSTPLVSLVVERLRVYVMRAQVTIEALDTCLVIGLHEAGQPSRELSILTAFKVPGSNDQMLLTIEDATPNPEPALLDAWKMAELQRGITWLCPETSGQFLPQMLDYDKLGAVNFKKGCYPGQEIVARTHYLGKVKRHPRLLCTTAMVCPNPLDKILISSGDRMDEAVITDCAQREDGGSCLFVVTRMGPDLVVEQIEYQGQPVPLA